MRYWLGPFVWTSEAGQTLWMPPPGALSTLDLRTLPEQGTAGGPAPSKAIFSTDDSVVLPAPWVQISDGPDERLGRHIPTIRQLFKNAPTGALTFGDVLYDLMTRATDPTGATAPKPIMPTGRRVMELLTGPLVRRVPFSLKESPEAPAVLAQIQHDYRFYAGEVAAGRMPADFDRRILMAWCEQFKLDPETEFDRLIPADLPKRSPLPHSTRLSEDFTGADGDTIGNAYTWTEYGAGAAADSFDRVSNAAAAVWAGSDIGTAKAGADVSSTNMYAYASVTALGSGTNNQQAGVAVRANSSNSDMYMNRVLQLNDVQQVLKQVSSVLTAIGAGATVTIAVPDETRLLADGSTIKSYYDGVEEYNFTDTAISSGTRGGIAGYDGGTGTAILDDWNAGDLYYTLTADAGSFTITGTDATIKRIITKLVADPGSFVITGTDATLKAQRRLTADPGSFSITGTAVTFHYYPEGSIKSVMIVRAVDEDGNIVREFDSTSMITRAISKVSSIEGGS